MKYAITTITKQIAARAQASRRFILAITGAPGAGKSILAEGLCAALNKAQPGRAEVLPMDGFHLDNAILQARGQLAQKGAPQTFDADGFGAVLTRIRAADQAGRDVVVPVFDRDMDLARAGGRVIAAHTGVIIVEGNYLLLDRPEWQQSDKFYDLSVFLDVPRATLKARLIARWRHHGLDPAAARARACGNDLTNADIVINQSRAADLTLTSPPVD